jgi:RimJ/RimL family protein N-acetyltransferase
MVVTAETLVAPPRVDAEVVRLGANDLEALQNLYALWPEASFRPEMVTESIAYGGYHDGQLVAVAGTHAYSRRYQIGAIGGVFTHPTYRCRGLATAATGAVAEALVARGVRDIILNVHADNEPAITAYRRLGFAEYMLFSESRAVLRLDER